MLQPPRPLASTFFNWRELATSLVQGLFITAGTLVTYQYAVHHGCDEAATRTMVFVALITANIFLTLVNRSFYYSIVTTTGYKNNLVLLIISATVLISVLMLLINPLRSFFEFEMLSGNLIGLSILAGFLSVIWYEGVKWFARWKGN